MPQPSDLRPARPGADLTTTAAGPAAPAPASTATTSGRAQGRHSRRELDPVLLTVCAGAMALVMADTIAATMIAPALVATPLPGGGGHLADLQWLSTVYTAPVAALLTVTGRTADLMGRRGVLAVGLALFAAGSLAIILTPTWPLLLLARAVQAIGIAAILPTSLALLLADVIPGRRAHAIAMWSAASGLGGIIGHLGGGLLGAHAGWRATFLPGLGAALLLLAATAVLPAARVRYERRRPDLLGAALVIVGLALLVLAISRGQAWQWEPVRVGGCVAGAVVLVLCAVRRSRTHPIPVIDLSLWRRPDFGWGWSLGLLYGASAFPLLFAAPLYLREVGLDAAQIGLRLLPLSGAVALASYLGTPLIRRAPGWGVLSGCGLAAAGSLMLAWSAEATAVGWAALIAIGFGIGLLSTAAAVVATLASPPQQYAAAVGACMTGRMTGGALGVAATAVALEHPLLGGTYAGYATVLFGLYAVFSLAITGTIMWMLGRRFASVPASNTASTTSTVSAAAGDTAPAKPAGALRSRPQPYSRSPGPVLAAPTPYEVAPRSSSSPHAYQPTPLYADVLATFAASKPYGQQPYAQQPYAQPYTGAAAGPDNTGGPASMEWLWEVPSSSYAVAAHYSQQNGHRPVIEPVTEPLTALRLPDRPEGP